MRSVTILALMIAMSGCSAAQKNRRSINYSDRTSPLHEEVGNWNANDGTHGETAGRSDDDRSWRFADPPSGISVYRCMVTHVSTAFLEHPSITNEDSRLVALVESGPGQLSDDPEFKVIELHFNSLWVPKVTSGDVLHFQFLESGEFFGVQEWPDPRHLRKN